jgi:hypothetical protein
MRHSIVLAVILLGLTACAGSDPRERGSDRSTRSDAGVVEDGGTDEDGGAPDAGDDEVDAGPVDAGGCVPVCGGRECGPDSCGGSCGPGCATGACGDDGRCHCTAGTHDGGDGQCVANDTCSPGFVLDVGGQCKACSSTSQCKLGEYCLSGRCTRSAVDCTDCSACAAGDCQTLAWVPQNSDWTVPCKSSTTRPACPAGSTRVCALDLNSICAWPPLLEESCWCELKRCVTTCSIVSSNCPSGYICQSLNGTDRCLPSDWGTCQ